MKSRSPFFADRRIIGIHIAQLREKKGLTQQELADATGIQRQNIGRAESGKFNTTLDTLLKIAYALDCDIKITSKK